MSAPAINLPDWLNDWLRDRAMSETADETACMQLAIALARENVERGAGGPFGAVLCDAAGRIVSCGVNLVPSSGNPVLHAEIVAYSLAVAAGAKLDGLTLVTSCEPCIMCLGASHWAGVARIVSGALKADAEACGFNEGVGVAELRADMQARGVSFTSGVMRNQATEVFTRYRELGRAHYGP